MRWLLLTLALLGGACTAEAPCAHPDLQAHPIELLPPPDMGRQQLQLLCPDGGSCIPDLR